MKELSKGGSDAVGVVDDSDWDSTAPSWLQTRWC